jgi:50S ribosomal subunit-associated GTPase HflX
VLAENMLFATLDPTTRRVQLPRSRARARAAASRAGDGGSSGDAGEEVEVEEEAVVEASAHGVRNKGQEVLLTDTVGFISKLPTDLIAAFRYVDKLSVIDVDH